MLIEEILSIFQTNAKATNLNIFKINMYFISILFLSLAIDIFEGVVMAK